MRDPIDFGCYLATPYLSDSVDLPIPGWIQVRGTAGDVKFNPASPSPTSLTAVSDVAHTWAMDAKEIGPYSKRVWSVVGGTTATEIWIRTE
jgi:hypothetical protein